MCDGGGVDIKLSVYRCPYDLIFYTYIVKHCTYGSIV